MIGRFRIPIAVLLKMSDLCQVNSSKTVLNPADKHITIFPNVRNYSSNDKASHPRRLE